MNKVSIRLIPALLAMLLTSTGLAQSVVRGPYLQTLTDSSVIVRWRTDLATDSVVRYGFSAGSLPLTETVAGSRTEHTVEVSGLNPATEYFYSIGTSGGSIEGNANYYFATAPVPGTPATTRIWVIGDSGTANTNAENVRTAYENWAGSNPADFMMMLGDNAYNDGTDAEYQAAVFVMYRDLLRRLPVWPTLGNHDGHSANSSTQSGPYYDIFDLPKAAEAGGLASGTEAYYSFDYGNIHFICLDSYETDRSVGGNMMQWLESDLAFNDKPWVIAFWHHPPYTKGSHNSDSEGQLIDMRQNALPILEAWGVDLVMAGHSHSYERSFLLDGHYGTSGTLNPGVHILDVGDGSISGDGAYEKPDMVAAENAGAVYAVAGSSGKVSGVQGDWPHVAMTTYLTVLGSLVLDVTGNQMDVTFIDDGGSVLDEFTIVKTPDLQAPMILDARAEDGTHVIVDYTERVDTANATDTANYSIPGLSISNAAIIDGNKSVRLTTGAMTPGASYVLTVDNVMDENGNTIAPNSQFGFDFIQQMTVFFQDGLAPDPGYDGTFDAYIREASANTNYGSATTLQVDGDEPSSTGTDMNIVIGWDVSDIPATATVDAATIHLNTLNVGGPYSCHGLLRAWNQAEVTWNEATTGNPWGIPGAEAASDRDSTLLCTFNAGSVAPLAINLNAAGVALVQSWVDGGLPNNGIVITDPATSNGADFDSSESATALNRPKLEITYTVPVIPPNQPPTASFNDSCTDLGCNFTDTSTDSDGSVVGWSWNFGDGNGSAAQNPNHTYASGGSYTVSLTVTDDGGETDQASTLVSVTPPNQPPSASFNDNCTDLGCNFTDTSTDGDGTIVSWSWDFGDGNSSNVQNPPHSYSVAGTYTVELTVTDNEGATDIATTDVTVSLTPSFTNVLASADIFGSGSVSGIYSATHADDDVTQSVTERESGGKKPDRHSFLVHTWQFDLPVNAMATVHANAWSGGSTDDEFRFSWSTDNSNYTELFVVASEDAANEQSWILPDGTVDTVYIRVEDTDRTMGNRTKDTVFIDHLYIRADSGAGDPPVAPTALNAAAAGPYQANLAWTDNADDESGFRVERSEDGSNFAEVGTTAANDPAFSDTNLLAGTEYWYRVRAWNPSGDSAWSNVSSVTTEPPPPAPNAPSLLAATASGADTIDIAWVDNSNTEQGFEIERSTDGSNFVMAGSTGIDVTEFQDSGLLPGTIYWYRAFAFNGSGDSAYSNTDSATTVAINLSLNGYKARGRHVVDLTWTGTTTGSVDIYRGDELYQTVSDSGAFTDATGNKGAATYEYQVCEAGLSICSAVESASF
jgi:PKD repeat protein